MNALPHARHLLTLDDLGQARFDTLITAARAFLRSRDELPASADTLAGRTVANLFFEPSTRTRASFELAARRLGADVVTLDVDMSSSVKGESIMDTALTMQAMGASMLVLRTAERGLPARIASQVHDNTAVLNAGEADVSHPTQGLADALTIRLHKPDPGGLTVAIVGDIAHSRVARSTAQALRLLGIAELRLVGPPALLPPPYEFPGAVLTSRLHDGLDGADVVIALRIQRERMADAELPDPAGYYEAWGLNEANLRPARPDALIMHPGPMNRGVEIADAVADGPRSVIREQVTNGVAIRMAVLTDTAHRLEAAS